MKISLVFLFLLHSSLVFSAGKIIFIRGEVKINNKKVTKKAELKRNDVITTGNKSLVVLTLENGSKVKLNENSSLSLSEAEKERTALSMKKGSAFFKVLKNKIRKQDKPQFNVRYKSVSMGIRGTSFFVSDGKDNSGDIWMCVNSGQVAVKSNSETKETLVNAGEGIVVAKGVATSKPKPLKWTEKLNWEMNPDKGDLVNKVSIQEAYTDLLEFDYD